MTTFRVRQTNIHGNNRSSTIASPSKDEALKEFFTKSYSRDAIIDSITWHEVSRNKGSSHLRTRVSRHESFPFENKDCAVIAVSLALGIEYPSAHRLLKVYGRVDREGTHLDHWMCHEGRWLFETVYSKHTSPPMTIKSLIKKNPEGTFLVTIDNHALTVKNGVILDSIQTGTKNYINYVYVPISPS